MDHILVYGDSLGWGIIPNTRRRFRFEQRWPGVLELRLAQMGESVRVVEDCLNGRRTVWEDPYKRGRNGLIGLEQRIEVNSPLSLVIVCLGTNDFQSVHNFNAWQSAQGLNALIGAIRQAPIEPGMPVPDILVIAPPPIQRVNGPIAPNFAGAEAKAQGFAAALQQVADETSCHFFDAGSVSATSKIDGVHLDEEQHQDLGTALADEVKPLLHQTK